MAEEGVAEEGCCHNIGWGMVGVKGVVVRLGGFWCGGG